MKLEERLVGHLSHHWDKWLLAGGIVYLLGVSLWLGQQNRLAFPWLSRQTPSLTTLKPSAPETDRRFIRYLQQSLKMIDQSTSSHPRTAASVTPSAANPSTFSTLTLQSPRPMPLPSPAVVPKVVEKYYYPLYPSVTTPPASIAIPRQPLPLAIAPPRQIPRNSMVPFVPSRPQSSSLSSSLPSASNIPPLVTAKTTYSLVGVLESGDRSSALFNWNGLTQRIQIGESLGASGWRLIGVNSQKAILSRQDKTRYLEVGQSF